MHVSASVRSAVVVKPCNPGLFLWGFIKAVTSGQASDETRGKQTCKQL